LKSRPAARKFLNECPMKKYYFLGDIFGKWKKKIF